MKTIRTILVFAAFASAISLSACKNRTSNTDNSEKQIAEKVKNLDVVAFANLYCKTTDMHKARLFLGKETDSLFTIEKDVENNYASVYRHTQFENILEFYMWTDKDGEKILGVNLIESGEKGHNRRSLQFFTYDARLNMAVPCKRLNEVITNKTMSLRRNFSGFLFRIPFCPEETENITLQYWDKQEKYHELVFVWDGKTFNVE